MITLLSRLLTLSTSSCMLTPMLNHAVLSRMAAPKKQQPVQGIKAHFDPPLLVWLRLEAKRLDISISEVLRRLVRKEMGT